MKISLGFGSSNITAEVPDKNIISILTPDTDNNATVNNINNSAVSTAADSESEIIRDALSDPIGTPVLKKIIAPGEKIVIITSDITRPLPSYKILPVVINELTDSGISLSDITIVFAIGSHRHHTEAEMRKLVGNDLYESVRCIDSDPDDCIHMGYTSNNTPVDITRIVSEADRRICIGNIEYHYFAGYSGGAKALMPGVSNYNAIQTNHSMMTDPKACAGSLENNPVRTDLEEAARICKIDFIVNVVLNEHKNIVYCAAGDFIKAHRAGCKYLDSLFRVNIVKKADIVIVSQGGAPKDLNLYQTQKALDNSKYAVKDGGTIILVGSCKEGFGNKTFENWIMNADSPDDLIDRVENDFKLGGHKAAAIAMVRKKAEIKLVSEMDPDLVKEAFMTPYTNLQKAIDDAINKHGDDASIFIIPYGGSVLPKLLT